LIGKHSYLGLLVSDYGLKVAVSKFQSSRQGLPSGGQLEKPPVSECSRLNEVIHNSAYFMLRIELTDSKPEHRMASLTVDTDGGGFNWGFAISVHSIPSKNRTLNRIFRPSS
jgi:hypothetical protein